MPRTVFARAKFKGRRPHDKKDPRGVTKVIKNRWYPFQITRVKRGVNNPTKLRHGLKPGTVVILLTGPYRGRRVVFLKQLKQSGLLKIFCAMTQQRTTKKKHTLRLGPFSVNGVPLRRVSQRFVIITSTKVSLGKSHPELDEIEDSYFRSEKTEKPKKSGKQDEKEEKKAETDKKEKFPESKQKIQTVVDTKLLAAISKVKFLKEYLASYFTLKSGQPPHQIHF
ncbi:hypothetical protein RFI_10539 [Reticulomyxa filosa]|uniref:60S ribosomal protein L6 n=1 Tax=Reticulomyxa filosa TaxID=46433 RepID=X6NKZ9_RETFI|nr:hypothetical protein RFI_10539 [Reticulomyxa filosa]|eukprot:ETO26598.1 hypothetical protein RFI_10539 [Reticulomyxa filosa]